MLNRRKIFTLAMILSLFFAISAAASTRGISLKITTGTKAGQSVDLYQGSHALLIGASDYTAGWPDLESIPAELSELQHKLENRGFNVVTVIDPSSRELSRAVEDFIDLYGFDENNRLLFFYSGHGYSRDNGSKGYLVPTDAPDPRKDEKGFLRKAINMSQILSWARQIEAKHAMFLFDSCFSGTVFKSRALPAFPPHINEATAKPVRQFISAGSAGEEVPARSVFVPALLRALDGEGDINHDGYMTGTELGMYLHNAVLNYQTFQTPQYGKIRDPELDEGDFVFVNPSYIDPDSVKPEEPAEPVISADEVHRREADAFWEEIKTADNPTMYQLFIERYPEHAMASLAEVKINELAKLAKTKREEEQRQQENLFWQSIQDSNSAAAFNAYLDEYPEGRFAKIAQLKVEQLSKTKVTEEQKIERQKLAQKRAAEEQKQEEEAIFWNSIRNSNIANLYQAYLDKYPQGQFVDLARMMITEAQKTKRVQNLDTGQKEKIKIAFLPIHFPRGDSKIHNVIVEGLMTLMSESLQAFEIVAAPPLPTATRISPRVYQFSALEQKKLWQKDGFFSATQLNLEKAIELCKQINCDIAIAYKASFRQKRAIGIGKREYDVEISLIDLKTKEVFKRDTRFWLWYNSSQEVSKLTQKAFKQYKRRI